ncbi:MAG: BlaI/MecI/CopY family transcriptional regulator [Calditrichia bacterium]
MSQDNTLSDLQMQIMRIIWAEGEASAACVHEKLNRFRPLATTTVATILSRLEKRGLLKHRAQSRQYLYSACVSEGEVKQSMVGDLLNRLFRGDVKAMVNHLVSESEINNSDLEDIRRLIEEREKSGGKINE